jgi:hypothetical protein
MHWRLAFPRAVVYHLGAVNSDHCPLLIDSNPPDYYAPRSFHFEVMLVDDPRCFDVMESAWLPDYIGSACFNLCKKQFNTTSALRKWNKEVFGHVQSNISNLTRRIERIQCKSRNEANAFEEAKLQQELNVWMARNEVMWWQKSRETWLKDGDRNSRIFHLSSIIRRKKKKFN